MVKDAKYNILISIMRKAMNHESIEREEIRQTLNYLWDKWPQGGKLSSIKMIAALVRSPGAVLSVPAFAVVLAHHMTPEVLCGLYDSYKDHSLFMEEDTSFKVPRVVSSTGTGGKEIQTVNVSTPSAIIAASSGGMVLRSGTRGFFNISGANDFLKINNIPIVTNLALVESIIDATGFTFIDGDSFNPNSRQIVNPVIRAGEDVQNLAKALSYPFRHAVTLLRPLSSEYAHRGVSLPITREVADALRLYRGFKRGVVVFGQDKDGRKFDEFSNVGPTEVSEFNTNEVRTFTIWPQDVGIPLRQTRDIEVYDRHQGYLIVLEVLQGKRTKGDPISELLALNAGSILYAGDFVNDLREGVEKALAAIAKGLPYNFIEKYRQVYQRLVNPHTAKKTVCSPSQVG